MLTSRTARVLLGDNGVMETTLYEATDPVSRDWLTVDRAGDRLLVRTSVDGRERVVVLCHGRDEGLRLAHALLAALETKEK